MPGCSACRIHICAAAFQRRRHARPGTSRTGRFDVSCYCRRRAISNARRRVGSRHSRPPPRVQPGAHQQTKSPLQQAKPGTATTPHWAITGTGPAADLVSSTCHGTGSCSAAPSPMTKPGQNGSRVGFPRDVAPGRPPGRHARRRPAARVAAPPAVQPRRTWAARQYPPPGRSTDSARRSRWHPAIVGYYKRRKYSRWARMYNTSLGWQGQRAVKTIKVMCALPGRELRGPT